MSFGTVDEILFPTSRILITEHPFHTDWTCFTQASTSTTVSAGRLVTSLILTNLYETWTGCTVIGPSILVSLSQVISNRWLVDYSDCNLAQSGTPASSSLHSGSCSSCCQDWLAVPFSCRHLQYWGDGLCTTFAAYVHLFPQIPHFFINFFVKIIFVPFVFIF